MTIVGPPDREPDKLAPGFKWCPTCGLHQYPAHIGPTILRNATGCPCCTDYDTPIQKPTPAHVVTWMTDDSQRIPQEAS